MPMPLRQLVRFGIVGLVNTGFAYAIFAMLLAFRIHYLAATLIGGLAGMFLGFQLSGRYVFGGRHRGHFLKFIIVFLLMYLVNVSIQRVLHPFVNQYLSGALATASCFFLSFALNRTFVFRADPLAAPKNYDQSYAQVQIQRSRSRLRRLIRKIYLNDILRYVTGPAIDFGCGAGDLLARLPNGSIGLEINPAAVDYCRWRNLNACLYDPDSDGYILSGLEAGVYTTMLFTHVIEHLDDPEHVIRIVLRACGRLGIQRVILTVPCARGFRFDSTHRTFVDETYLRDHGLGACEGYIISLKKYFPINWKWIGEYYTFHELRIILDREPLSPISTEGISH